MQSVIRFGFANFGWKRVLRFMGSISQFVSHVDSMIWSMVLVLLCLGSRSLFINSHEVSSDLFTEGNGTLGAKKSENGITPFQAFATTVGARVEYGQHCGVWRQPLILADRDPFSGCGSLPDRGGFCPMQENPQLDRLIK